jgi:hypothetical protein
MFWGGVWGTRLGERHPPNAARTKRVPQMLNPTRFGGRFRGRGRRCSNDLPMEFCARGTRAQALILHLYSSRKSKNKLLITSWAWCRIKIGAGPSHVDMTNLHVKWHSRNLGTTLVSNQKVQKGDTPRLLPLPLVRVYLPVL